MQQRNEDFIVIAATKNCVMRAYKKLFNTKKYHINKNRGKTTLSKIKEGKSKTIRKLNVAVTRLNYGAIHSIYGVQTDTTVVNKLRD